MTPYELGWVVGILEGEGCFTCSRSGKYKQFTVSVEMTDKDVIDKLCQTVGLGSVVHRPERALNGNRKETWRWKVGDKEGFLKLATEVLPHMGERRSLRIKELLTELANY